MKKWIVIFLLSFTGHYAKAANVDSLLQVVESPDSVQAKLDAYVGLMEHYFFNNNDSCEFYGYKLIEFAHKVGNPRFEGIGYHFVGLIYYYSSNMPKTIEFYYRALDNYIVAKDSENVSMIYSGLGNVYAKLEDPDKALENYKKAEKWIEFGDKTALSYLYHNIGITYKKKEEFEKAIDYYNQSLKIKEELGDEEGIAITYNNFGTLYESMGEVDQAEKYYTLSVELKRKTNDVNSLAVTLPNLGRIYIKSGRIKQGLALCEEAYDIYESQDFNRKDKDACLCLYEGNEALGNIPLAFKYYKEFIAAKDSLFSYEKTKELVQQEASYEYEKQRLTDSLVNAKKDEIQEAQIAKSEAEIESRRKAQYLLYGGIGAIGLIAFILFNRFRTTHKQKKIIEDQKVIVEKALDELEEKNGEILDSIIYAKRIQSAILPPDDLFFSNLPNAFVLYKPKDIVAGDFYWMETHEDKVLVAAADCTGHGVPGAMVSVFCSNGLNRSVREHDITDPGKILDKTREIVVREFEKSDENVKDGMDIALLSIEGNKIGYSGANNPLWIIRKGATEVEEIKADKQPIGKFSNPVPYSTHYLTVNSGDTLYIFTDGFQDQFGGEKGKKFKAKNFKDLILSIQHESIFDQKELINAAFEKWRGQLEQVDDVCVIGVRI